MKRRTALNRLSIATTGFLTSLAGCASERGQQLTETPGGAGVETETEQPAGPDRRQDVDREVWVAPTSEDEVTHDNFSHEFREVDGERILVISITTRNTSDGPQSFQYKFSFKFLDSADIERVFTVPEDSEIGAGETHEWEVQFKENLDNLNRYIVAIRPVTG